MGDFAAWLSPAPPTPATAFDAHRRLVGIHPFIDGNGRTALTIAKGGPKLHVSDLSPVAVEAPRNPALAMGTETRSGHLIFRSESMADLAWALSRTNGLDDRPVVDRTGLTGRFDFELTFQPERRSDAAGEPISNEQSLFLALQQQLGLKLDSTRAAVEFLTIEHVERPTGN